MNGIVPPVGVLTAPAAAFDAWGVLAGAVLLGLVHGVEPGHGWPVAASYALDRPNKWFSGLAAGLIIGVGHLVSSLAVVGVFFLAKRYFALTRVNAPVVLTLGDASVAIGGPVGIAAGVLLILLGIGEYRGGHDHGHGGKSSEDHAHEDDRGSDHDHSHHEEHAPEDEDGDRGLLARLTAALPFGGGHSHGSDHGHGSLAKGVDEGLWGIASAAFVLGFAHEEEFEIIALCAGSSYCLELMSAYALAVIAALVTLTLVLVAGYYRFEERVEAYAPYLPAFSAAVLVVMGVGFVIGLF